MNKGGGRAGDASVGSWRRPNMAMLPSKQGQQAHSKMVWEYHKKQRAQVWQQSARAKQYCIYLSANGMLVRRMYVRVQRFVPVRTGMHTTRFNFGVHAAATRII